MTVQLGFQSCTVFDIDGTLANINHRRHYVQYHPKNWTAFNRSMHLDTPNHDIIWLLDLMRSNGSTILIASGRGEEQRDVTQAWLAAHHVHYTRLYMRPAKDYRRDDIIKSEILDQMRADGFDPTMAIDDRDQVVAMWRTRGLRCLQVADGNF